MFKKTIQSRTIQEARRLIDDALVATESRGGSFEEFHKLLLECATDLESPMRVAFVGMIKTSKSTLVNAILGEEEVLHTGDRETTWNVSWLRHGPANQDVKVVYKDPRTPAEYIPRDQWGTMANRNSDGRFRDSVQYFDVTYECESLRHFDIVDTPGLGALNRGDQNGAEGQDSINTRVFLEEKKPDAIVYLFRRGLAKSDVDLAENFQGTVLGLARPVNAIGVLSRFDDSIPLDQDPLKQAHRIARRLEQEPKVAASLFRVFPVCARMALGAKTMTEEEFAWLKSLSNLPAETIFDWCDGAAERFVNGTQEIPLAPESRSQLRRRLTTLGIYLAVERIRTCPEGSLKDLRRELELKSGFTEFLKALQVHFGNRSVMLKLHGIFAKLRGFCHQKQAAIDPAFRECIYWFSRELQRYESRFQEVQRLDELVRLSYENKLGFSPAESQELELLSGSKGRNCAERLGLDKATSLAKLAAVAAERQMDWNGKATSLGSLNLAYREAAKAMKNGYGSLLRDIKDAERLLDGE